MNTTIASALRLVALAATLTFVTASASAKKADPAARAAELLARYGTIPVDAAGPYIEIGSFLIQVRTKLGRPTAVLHDGTWLYQGYCVDDSDVHGTLVVRFAKDRVHSMSLVTPAVAAAMMTPPAPGKRGSTKLGVNHSILCCGGHFTKSLE